MLVMTPEIEALQAKAKAGDVHAGAQFSALKWNSRYQAGSAVFYEKSPQEGRVLLKTCGLAYVLGDTAVVELEHVGTVMLTKLEPYATAGQVVLSQAATAQHALLRRDMKIAIPLIVAAFAVAVWGFTHQAEINLFWLHVLK
jgi:hypothetical protein